MSAHKLLNLFRSYRSPHVLLNSIRVSYTSAYVLLNLYRGSYMSAHVQCITEFI